MSNNTINSTLSVPLFDQSESRIIGLLYLFMSLIYAIPYILCLYIMHSEPDSRHSPVYRIMIHMGYSEMIQLLLSGALSSSYSLCYSKKYFLLNKLCSGLAEASWFSYLALSQLLALNRVFWVYAGENKVQSWFSMPKTRIYIFVCWIPGIVYTVIFALPNVDFVYMVDIGTFGPLYSPTVEVLFTINLIVDIMHSISQILWYALIYMRIKVQVKNLNEIGRKRSHKADQNILIQAFLLCCTDILVIICWHTMTRLIDIDLKNRLMYKVCYVFTNLTWFMCSGNNVFVYLLFNSLIQDRTKRILCNRAKVSIKKRVFSPPMEEYYDKSNDFCHYGINKPFIKTYHRLDKLNKPSIHDDNQFLLCMNERMVTFEYHVS